MTSACAHDHAPSPSAASLSDALAAAEQRVANGGQRWTEPRRRVYELLLRAGRPTKAYDLMERYAADRTAKPPTVYRALEFLEAQGLVHRIASLNAYQACGGGDHAHAASFLICDCCGAADEFSPAIDDAVAFAAEVARFTPAMVTLEVRGRCGRCTA